MLKKCDQAPFIEENLKTIKNQVNLLSGKFHTNDNTKIYEEVHNSQLVYGRSYVCLPTL